jgi:hypothetical protein
MVSGSSLHASDHERRGDCSIGRGLRVAGTVAARRLAMRAVDRDRDFFGHGTKANRVAPTMRW